MRLQMFVFAYLMLQLRFHGYFALNPEGVSLLAFGSKVEIDSFEALQNWDRRDDDPCEWNGVHCVDGRVGTLNLEGMKLGGTLTPEIGKLGHLKALLLCGKKFEGGTHSWTEKNNKNFQLKTNKNHPCDGPGAINCMKSKFGHNFWRRGLQNCKGGSFVILSKGKFLDSFDVWFVSKLKNKYSHRRGGRIQNNLLTTSYISLHMVRRHLLQESKNLPSAIGSSSPPHTVSVPSHGSGSFAAIPNSEGSGGRKTPSADPSYKPNTLVDKGSKSASRSWPKWIFTLIIPTIIIILIIIMALIVVYQRNATAIDAWRTGLSGPLRNAFITGVPKLNRAELEAACEDFSNITIIYPNCTVFKGILSSGVEIAVASTKAKSRFDWSERSDSQFRNKIDTISRINHKNFVNLLGYCQEDDPFMRMMVFEYAPNGTLFEHLHVKEFEHLDWSTRMRIIMGIGYCLQHMHDLNPAVAHPILQSSCIFLTDDYAAKIADLGIFSEPIGKETDFLKDKDNSVPAPTSDPESNVYSFGILLLEIISGRMPISEDDGLPISDWAMEHLKDTKSIKSLVDPSLTFNKDNELHIICKVAEACIQEDSKCRPTMKEVSALLREVLRIEPEAAVPRLSPLWWAELEILSVEAS